MKRAHNTTIRERVREEIDRAFQRPPPPPPRDAMFLGWHPGTGVRGYVLPADLDTHAAFIGGSRKGKTNALKKLIRVVLKRWKKYGEGLSIVDPHGGLAQSALEQCAALKIDPNAVYHMSLRDAPNVLSINPVRRTGGDPYYQAACVREALIKVFDQTRSQDKKLVSRVLLNLAQAQIEAGLTLLESRYFLTASPQAEAVLKGIVAQRLPDGDCRDFWLNHLALPAREAEMQAMGPANRLDDLIRPPVLRRMLGVGVESASLDVLEVMNGGRVAIYDTSLGKDTEITPDGQALLNAVLLEMYRQAFPRRTPKDSRDYDPRETPPHTLIADEFGGYASNAFARTFQECSKFGLRLITSFQSMSMLISPDGDKQLYNAILAVPNKVVFGNLPFEEAEELARHIFLSDLDPDRIKYQGTNVTWDPDMRWTLNGRSHGRGGGTSTAVSTSRSRNTASAASHADTFDGEGKVSGSTESQSETSSESESDSESTTHSSDWSETESWGWVTFHKKRIQKQTPVYRSVEEQVFKAAQALSTNPKGVAIIGTENRKPALCLFPNMDNRPVTDEELAAFMSEMYKKPEYLPKAQAERFIHQRQVRLIEAAPVQKQPKPVKVRRGRPFMVKD